MKPVIICGGVGTKMWPMSSPEMPKHFLPLIGEKSLFEINYSLVRKNFKAADIFISTSKDQEKLVRKLAADVPESNLIFEPSHQDTGPAIGLVAAELYKRGIVDETFVMIQTDVLRTPEDSFLETLKLIDELVQKNSKWVTGAIKPPFAMMGVDYMISGEIRDGVGDLKEWLMGVNKEEVEQWVTGGKAWLHANHYACTPRLWLESYLKWKPEWGEPLMKIARGEAGLEIYPQIPKGRTEDWTKISVTKNEGMMVELPFDWRDFGTWESVDKYLMTNDKGQMTNENVVEIEAKNNFVKSDYSAKPVAIIGLDNIVVIDSPKGLLVCPKDKTGKVGEVVKRLSEK